VPAPTIRALAVLVLLAAALVAITGAVDGPAAVPHAAPGPSRVAVLGEQVTRTGPTATSSTTTSTATTSSSRSSTTTTTARTVVTAPPPVPATGAPPPAAAPAPPMSCVDALAYLAAHQAPGFTDSCADGSAFGHLGVTCVNQPGMCEGRRVIRIACPAPFVYMNEAHNSWTLTGQGSGIDPYGQGSAADRAACATHR
jgi:hypothetical protein